MSANEADLELFAQCFGRNGTPRQRPALDWQYLQNPTRQLHVDLTLDGQTLAAIYAVQPCRLWCGGQRRLAAQSVDTLVDADYRGQGLFTRGATAVFDRLAQAGAACVYGFPNKNSAPGFFSKLGWQSLDPVPFMFRPLRSGFFTRKLFGGSLARALPNVVFPVGSERWRGSLEQSPPLDAQLTALWDRFKRPLGCAVQRDADYMRWRLSKPGADYTSVGAFTEGKLVAFCATRVVDKHGARIAYVIESMHDSDHPDAASAVLRHALLSARRQGAELALAWNLSHSPNHAVFRRARFLPLPERLRPIELHFGVRAFRGDLRPILTDRRQWYLSYCDSDTV